MVEAKSCTRVDFAGGTLDLWPLYRLIPECKTVNASINCFTSVSFEKTKNLEISVISPDFAEEFSFANFDDFLKANDGKLSILQHATSIVKDKNLLIGKWVIKSESPAGSGLGGSSSLLISMLKVILKVEGKEGEVDETKLIQIARDIESTVLKTPAGIQDYFSPVKKGLNVISYEPMGFKRDSLDSVGAFWKERVLIVDSKIKHHSGFNNWQILKSFIENDEKVVLAMNDIARISVATAKALEDKDPVELAKCFQSELEARKAVSVEYISKDLASFITKLNEIKEVKSLKVCGAGGGGCLIILFEPESKDLLLANLNERGVKVLPFELEI